MKNSFNIMQNTVQLTFLENEMAKHSEKRRERQRNTEMWKFVDKVK